MNMWKYIVKRIGYFIPTILGVSIIVFILVRLIPGNPIEIILGMKATPELEELAKRQLGLDKPIYIQFFYWLRNMAAGNWGQSIFSRIPVIDLILFRFRFTLKLALISMVEVVIFGLSLGILSALTADTVFDKLFRTLTILIYSPPYFVTALILMYVFSLYLGILPSMGAESAKHLLLPSFSLSFVGMAYISRITRGSILEVVGEDYVKTARAKGLPRMRIIIYHVLKNALLPIITVLGLQFGWFLSGSFIIETIFSLPGLGELATRSILNRDYPVVQGSVFFIALLYSSINLIVDVIYTFLDPRVQYERSA